MCLSQHRRCIMFKGLSNLLGNLKKSKSSRRSKGGACLRAALMVEMLEPRLVPSNLIANGGFETGDFTGWTLGGNNQYNSVWSGIGDHSTYAAALGPVGS